MHTIRTSETTLDDLVTVRFEAPVAGRDPFDGETFMADRHRVAAVLARQDATETVFIDEEGEILSRWPTRAIVSVDWPMVGSATTAFERRNGGSSGDHGVGTKEWLAEVKLRHPRAYEAWPAHEDADLRNEHESGLSVAEIAEQHRRRPSAIRSRLRKLDLT